MTDFPEDMPKEIKMALEIDILVYGDAWFEKRINKEGKVEYERVTGRHLACYGVEE